MDIQTITDQGAALYATAEKGLADAMGALIALSALHVTAYQHGHQAGGAALFSRDSLISLAGEIATVHSRVVGQHTSDFQSAQAAGGSPAGPYQELPPLLVPQPKSGTGR